MLKNTLIAFVLLIAVVAFGVWYFTPHAAQAAPQSPSITAIPLNAAFIIEVKHPSKLKQKLEDENKLWKTLKTLDLFANIAKEVQSIDSIVRSEKTLQPYADSVPVTISVHPTGPGNYSCLYTLALSKTFPVLEVPEIIYRILPGKEIKHKNYDGDIISWVQLEQGPLYFTLKNKLLQVSTNSILIEEAIRQASIHQSLLNETSFARLVKSQAPQAELNLYVNLYRLPGFLERFVNRNNIGLLRSLNSFNEWMVLDGNFSNTELVLNGFSGSNDSSNSFLGVFKGQQPQPIAVWSTLPTETAFMVHYGISNTKTFYHAYKKFLETQHAFFDYTKSTDAFKAKFHRDPETQFVDRFEKEIGCFTTVSPRIGAEPEHYAFFRSADPEKDDELFLSLADTLARKQKQRLDTVNYHGKTILHLPVDDFLPLLFGQLMQGLHKTYLTRLGNYWIAGNSTASLRTIIDHFEAGQVMSKATDIPDLTAKNATESSVYCYIATPKFLQSVKSYLSDPYTEAFDKSAISLRKLQHLTLQFSSTKADFYTHCYINYTLHPKVEFNPLWDYELPDAPHGAPILLFDSTANTTLVAIQDEKNTLYLFNEAGKKMWKRKIGEAIQSPIHLAAGKHNGKPHLAFTTAIHKWMLDQKGNTISPYPTKIKGAKNHPLPEAPAKDSLCKIATKQLGLSNCATLPLNDPHQKLLVGYADHHVMGVLISLP